MLIYVTTDASPIAGSVWPKGTRLEAPDAAAMAAVASGIASFDPPKETKAAPVIDDPESEPANPAPVRRGRPPKA